MDLKLYQWFKNLELHENYIEKFAAEDSSILNLKSGPELLIWNGYLLKERNMRHHNYTLLW